MTSKASGWSATAWQGSGTAGGTASCAVAAGRRGSPGGAAQQLPWVSRAGKRCAGAREASEGSRVERPHWERAGLMQGGGSGDSAGTFTSLPRSSSREGPPWFGSGQPRHTAGTPPPRAPHPQGLSQLSPAPAPQNSAGERWWHRAGEGPCSPSPASLAGRGAIAPAVPTSSLRSRFRLGAGGISILACEGLG